MSVIVTSMIYALHSFNSATEDCCQTLVKMLQKCKPNPFTVGNDEKQMILPQSSSSHLNNYDCWKNHHET
jgi:hypothetical protein